MGLREQLSKVVPFLENARSKGRELRDDATAEPGASSAAEQVSQREARRREAMTAEDREWEQASQQRHRERQARSSEPATAANEPTIAAGS